MPIKSLDEQLLQNAQSDPTGNLQQTLPPDLDVSGLMDMPPDLDWENSTIEGLRKQAQPIVNEIRQMRFDALDKLQHAKDEKASSSMLGKARDFITSTTGGLVDGLIGDTPEGMGMEKPPSLSDGDWAKILEFDRHIINPAGARFGQLNANLDPRLMRIWQEMTNTAENQAAAFASSFSHAAIFTPEVYEPRTPSEHAYATFGELVGFGVGIIAWEKALLNIGKIPFAGMPARWITNGFKKGAVEFSAQTAKWNAALHEKYIVPLLRRWTTTPLALLAKPLAGAASLKPLAAGMRFAQETFAYDIAQSAINETLGTPERQISDSPYANFVQNVGRNQATWLTMGAFFSMGAEAVRPFSYDVIHSMVSSKRVLNVMKDLDAAMLGDYEMSGYPIMEDASTLMRSLRDDFNAGPDFKLFSDVRKLPGRIQEAQRGARVGYSAPNVVDMLADAAEIRSQVLFAHESGLLTDAPFKKAMEALKGANPKNIKATLDEVARSASEHQAAEMSRRLVDLEIPGMELPKEYKEFLKTATDEEITARLAEVDPLIETTLPAERAVGMLRTFKGGKPSFKNNLMAMWQILAQETGLSPMQLASEGGEGLIKKFASTPDVNIRGSLFKLLMNRKDTQGWARQHLYDRMAGTMRNAEEEALMRELDDLMRMKKMGAAERQRRRAIQEQLNKWRKGREKFKREPDVQDELSGLTNARGKTFKSIDEFAAATRGQQKLITPGGLIGPEGEITGQGVKAVGRLRRPAEAQLTPPPNAPSGPPGKLWTSEREKRLEEMGLGLPETVARSPKNALELEAQETSMSIDAVKLDGRRRDIGSSFEASKGEIERVYGSVDNIGEMSDEAAITAFADMAADVGQEAAQPSMWTASKGASSTMDDVIVAHNQIEHFHQLKRDTFGTKVAHADGQPAVVYVDASPTKVSGRGEMERGAYAFQSRKIELDRVGRESVPAFVKLSNPKVVPGSIRRTPGAAEIREMEKAGYDGIIAMSPEGQVVEGIAFAGTEIRPLGAQAIKDAGKLPKTPEAQLYATFLRGTNTTLKEAGIDAGVRNAEKAFSHEPLEFNTLDDFKRVYDELVGLEDVGEISRVLAHDEVPVYNARKQILEAVIGKEGVITNNELSNLINRHKLDRSAAKEAILQIRAKYSEYLERLPEGESRKYAKGQLLQWASIEDRRLGDALRKYEDVIARPEVPGQSMESALESQIRYVMSAADSKLRRDTAHLVRRFPFFQKILRGEAKFWTVDRKTGEPLLANPWEVLSMVYGFPTNIEVDEDGNLHGEFHPDDLIFMVGALGMMGRSKTGRSVMKAIGEKAMSMLRSSGHSLHRNLIGQMTEKEIAATKKFAKAYHDLKEDIRTLFPKGVKDVEPVGEAVPGEMAFKHTEQRPASMGFAALPEEKHVLDGTQTFEEMVDMAQEGFTGLADDLPLHELDTMLQHSAAIGDYFTELFGDSFAARSGNDMLAGLRWFVMPAHIGKFHPEWNVYYEALRNHGRAISMEHHRIAEMVPTLSSVGHDADFRKVYNKWRKTQLGKTPAEQQAITPEYLASQGVREEIVRAYSEFQKIALEIKTSLEKNVPEILESLPNGFNAERVDSWVHLARTPRKYSIEVHAPKQGIAKPSKPSDYEIVSRDNIDGFGKQKWGGDNYANARLSALRIEREIRKAEGAWVHPQSKQQYPEAVVKVVNTWEEGAAAGVEVNNLLITDFAKKLEAKQLGALNLKEIRPEVAERVAERSEKLKNSMFRKSAREAQHSPLVEKTITTKGDYIAGYNEDFWAADMAYIAWYMDLVQQKSGIEAITKGMTEFSNQMTKNKMGELVPIWEAKPRLHDYMETHAENFVRGFEYNRWRNALGVMRQMAFIKYIGSNLRSIVLQATQPIVMAIPRLSEEARKAGHGLTSMQGKGTVSPLKEYAVAIKDLASGGVTVKWGDRMHFGGNLTKDEVGLFEYSYRSGNLVADLATEKLLRGGSEGVFMSTHPNFKRVLKGLTIAGFNGAEAVNRLSVTLTAYRTYKKIYPELAKAAEMGDATARNRLYARSMQMNLETNFEYAYHNRPEVARKWGGVLSPLMLFKGIIVNYNTLVFQYLHHGVPLVGGKGSGFSGTKKVVWENGSPKVITEGQEGFLGEFFKTSAALTALGGIMANTAYRAANFVNERYVQGMIMDKPEWERKSLFELAVDNDYVSSAMDTANDVVTKATGDNGLMPHIRKVMRSIAERGMPTAVNAIGNRMKIAADIGDWSNSLYAGIDATGESILGVLTDVYGSNQSAAKLVFGRNDPNASFWQAWNSGQKLRAILQYQPVMIDGISNLTQATSELVGWPYGLPNGAMSASGVIDQSTGKPYFPSKASSTLKALGITSSERARRMILREEGFRRREDATQRKAKIKTLFRAANQGGKTNFKMMFEALDMAYEYTDQLREYAERTGEPVLDLYLFPQDLAAAASWDTSPRSKEMLWLNKRMDELGIK